MDMHAYLYLQWMKSCLLLKQVLVIWYCKYFFKINHQVSLVMCCCYLAVVDLPSPHHRWYVTNSSVAHVDIMMGVVHALNLGITDIIVEDTRVSGHAQTSTMHIVIPDKLCLYIVPVTNDSTPLEGMAPISSSDVWYVFPGQEYIVHIKVFSKGPDANGILVTEV